MIVIDISAVLAIALAEPEADIFSRRIANDELPLMSAGSLLEASIVLRGKRNKPPNDVERWLDIFLDVTRIRVEPVTSDHIAIARAAHRRFGKGTGHPARLNFGDCFSYALARAKDAPLLFKGDDFSRTDVTPAI